MERPRRLLGAAAFATVAVAALVVASTPELLPGTASPPPWPSAPYAHSPLHETSVAAPVALGGDVGIMVGGLEKVGFFCAQVRANDAAVQVWCRHAEPVDDPDGLAVTVVDLVSTPAGALQYAHVTLPDRPVTVTRAPRPYRERLRAVLEASLLAVWPEDRDVVRAAVDDLGTSPRGWDPGDPREPETRTARTASATYTVSELPDVGYGTVDEDPALELMVSTLKLRQRSWPYGSEHYATTTVAAAPGLEAGGFDCYGDIEQPCTRPAGNQQIDYRTFEDTNRVLSIRFGVGGGVLDPAVGLEPLAAWGLPQGLTFLSEDVRPAVEERLAAVRASGESFTGIVAGVVVVLDARRTPVSPDGAYGVHVQATIGTPLVTVPLP